MKSFSELPDPTELSKLWKQEPVADPEPDLELTPDSWIERGAEVIGWAIARSNTGSARAAGSGVAAAELLPRHRLTSAGLLLLRRWPASSKRIASSSHWLGIILGHLFAVLTHLPPVVLSVGALYLGFVAYRRYRRRRLSHRGGYPHDEYYQ